MTSMAYLEATGRNAGFVTADEQRRLFEADVLVCGVGGMGGAAVQVLARAGVGGLGLADMDVFEPSNLNRQVFATHRTLGRSKTDATAEGVREIQPDARVEVLGAEWTRRLDELLPRYPVVINAMDDLRAGILLYRAARRHRCTVVDAYTSPLPSVTVVRPGDPTPEERLRWPTRGLPADALTDELLREAFLREVAWVLAVSPVLDRIDPDVVAGILAGTRPRSSFAPVVILAGTLMAHEAIRALLGRPSGAGHRGYFLDTDRGRVHTPGPTWWVRLRAATTRRALSRLGPEQLP